MFCMQDNCVYTMGFVHVMPPDEWAWASHRPCGPVYINLSGPRPRLTQPSAPVYNTHGRLNRPCRFTAPRPTQPSTLVYNVAVDSPIHTGLKNTMAEKSVSTRGRLGRDWFQFHHGDHQLRGDNCWPGASGEIHPAYFYKLYIAFFKRAITPVCKLSHAGFKPVYITVNYEESQANSSSRLETRGLWCHGSVNIASLKAVRKLSVQNKDSGLKSVSRDISLLQSFQALKSGSNIRLKVNLSLTKL